MWRCCIPKIGQYKGDALVNGDYQFLAYNSDGTQIPTSTFTTTPPVYHRRKRSNSKTDTVIESWDATAVETVINLIDTSNGTNYVFINDPARNKTLVGLWNGWIETFAAYSSPLGVLSADPGVNVLTSINQTRYWNAVIGRGNVRLSEVRDQRVVANKAISSTVYSSRQAFAVSFREKPFQATASITTNWILPVIKFQVGGGSPNSSAFAKIAALYDEEISQVMSTTGDSGMLMSTLHDDFASSMVHAKGVQSVFDEELSALSAAGHAGILSSLVANFIGNTFGKTAGTVAEGFASALPI